ncbi:hypothetical protein L6307_05175 [Candidatus Parcubacteria bacterium]|nr:hypothetical protein [Candidatus Parcubacteria bacterium]MCG2700080.1 hypothetical protein [Candidatus Parcubacteria bacterium]
MSELLVKNSNNIVLPKKDYLELLEVYQKLGVILFPKEKKKSASALKTLYGIWQGAKVDEKDFQQAKQSLFKASL